MENVQPKRLSWIAAIAISACVCLIAWLISGWIVGAGRDAMLTDVTLLPCSTAQQVELWREGVIYNDGATLHALDGSGRQKWTYPMGTGLNFAVSDRAIAAWSGSSLALLDAKSGASLLATTLSEKIISARVGASYAAVLVGEEHSANMIVLDLNGKQVDSIDLSSLTILDFDFFSGGSMLWVMALNTEGSQSMSRIATYRPGRVQSGSISDTGQLVYRVLFTDSQVLTVGTNYLKRYDYTGLELTEQRKLLYGWTLVECDPLSNNPLMVFTPEQEVGSKATISDLRIVQGDNDRIIRMPFPCYAIQQRDGTLYGFSGRYVMCYPLSARRATTYSLPFETTSLLGITDANAAVLVSGDSIYLVSLP